MIVNLETTLVHLAKDMRSRGLVIVMANGCFDVLHYGHISHLKVAKKMGDVLVVTVTRDEDVNKGQGRPMFDEVTRMQAVDALACVDYVCLNNSPGIAIKLVRPHLYVKGPDYRFKMTEPLQVEKIAVESYGGRLVFTDTPEFHSTDIIARGGI